MIFNASKPIIEEQQGVPAICDVPESLDIDTSYTHTPSMRTMCIAGGKKQKLRPGDILGALTGGIGIDKKNIGKINIGDYYSYVAIKRSLAREICSKLNASKIKGRSFKLQLIS